MKDLIAVGVKTHFVYYVVAKNNGYKQPLPDVLEDRPGPDGCIRHRIGSRRDSHTRADNSFIEIRAER